MRSWLYSIFILTSFLPSYPALATTIRKTSELTLDEVVNGSLGPFDNYCDGYGNPGSNGLGYISFLKLETGKVKLDLDQVLEEIISFDRAETLGTYIGQINMITVSSFNGINGAIWGYHLAKAESIANGTQKPLFEKKRSDGTSIPVYSMDPLLDAGQRLCGTMEQKRFPMLPGAHVPCALKSAQARGPTYIWCGAALAIAENRDKDANLFIEDVGNAPPAKSQEENKAFLNDLFHKVAESIIRRGDDSNVKYKEIYIGFKTEWIPEGYLGCALACAPFVVLAKNAIPIPNAPKDLVQMTISEWESKVGIVVPKIKSSP